MQALAELAAQDPNYRQPALEIIEPPSVTGSFATRNIGRKLVAKLEQPSPGNTHNVG
jgi:hypothetical protein